MDQKNFIVAIVLSVLIIVGWQHFFQPAKPPVPPPQTTSQTATPQTPAGQSTAPGVPGAPSAEPAAAQILSRKDALAASPRVTFDTPELVGSIALKGGRIDDVRLVKYRETIDPKSDAGAGAVAGRRRASLLRRVRLGVVRAIDQDSRGATRCGPRTRRRWRRASRCD